MACFSALRLGVALGVCARVCVCVVEGFLASFVRVWLGFLLSGDWELRGGCRVLAPFRLFSGTWTLILASLQALSGNSLPDLSSVNFGALKEPKAV